LLRTPSAFATKAWQWNIDPDELLAAGDDGTPASEDFGDLIVSDCFIPQIVYSTTFGYRTDMVGDTPPTNICDVFDLEKYPGKRALEKRPINNMEWALLCDGVAKEDVYDVLETEEGQAQALAKLDTIKDQVSGGPPAPIRRSFSRTAKSSWVRPTMAVSSA
jgi:putative spermidine/putrescine transport system substrate-binding protein